MNNFFELLENRIGFSRIGRMNLSKDKKFFIRTPNVTIPIKNVLMKQFSFIQEFENHDLFIISKEIFLKIGFLQEKFRDTGFIFTHPGTLERFENILQKNLDIFSRDNVLALIPFNIPTITIGYDFSRREVEHYVKNVEKILRNHPDINFGLSIRLFDYFELLDLYLSVIKANDNIKILNLDGIFNNFGNFRTIIKTIITLKKKLDNNLIIMASGRILPKFYPILVYLGVDLIDTTYLLYLSAENFYDTIEYLLPIYKVKYLPCSCVACKGNLKNLYQIKHSVEKTDLLCLHNLISANNYMRKIKQYLRYEDFRAFVEKSSMDDINMISTLKILDKEYFTQVRYETPIAQKDKKIICFGQSSYYRPDFEEFRNRTIKNFEPEEWTNLIILLPCSAKKPYSSSKSHKKFYRSIRKFPEFPNFQEIIITSPLGAIPRQLEDVYPVNSYDISVTGDWDEEEKNITSKMLLDLLNKYDKSIPIICHLDGKSLEIVKQISNKQNFDIYYTVLQENATSNESLKYLEEVIKEHISDYKPENEIVKGNYLSKTWIRKFIKISDYQFGVGSGNKIIKNDIILKKNKTNTRISLIDVSTKENLGRFEASTGQISLSINGIKRITLKPFSLNSNIIIFDGDHIRGNNLFRKGILDYSLDLIPESFVAVIDNLKQNIIGVGRIVVGTNFLKNSNSGKVIEIYEKI
jgi:archaeosine synthase